MQHYNVLHFPNSDCMALSVEAEVNLLHARLYKGVGKCEISFSSTRYSNNGDNTIQEYICNICERESKKKVCVKVSRLSKPWKTRT